MKKLLLTVVKIVVFFIGWALLATVLPIPDDADGVYWRFFAELMPLLAVVIFNGLFWLIDRRSVPIGLWRAGSGWAAVLGVVTGLVWIGAAVGLLLALSCMTIDGWQTVPQLWLWLVALFLNTVMQELLVRGYLYQRIKASYSVPVAAVISTLIFLLCHGGALEAGWLPCVNIVLMSFFVTAVLEYTGSLVAPVMIHFLWNSIGGIILGGVSLADDYPHMIDITMHGNAMLSGGAFKIEGSLVVLVLNAVFFAAFAVLAWRKRRKQST